MTYEDMRDAGGISDDLEMIMTEAVERYESERQGGWVCFSSGSIGGIT